MPAALVAHASADWTDANVDRDLAQVQQELSAATGALTGLDMNRSTHMALHRWRYALVDAETAATEPFIDMSAGLAATGDLVDPLATAVVERACLHWALTLNRENPCRSWYCARTAKVSPS